MELMIRWRALGQWMVLGLLAVAGAQGAQEVQRRARPDWVIPAEFEVPETIEEGSGSVRYLVADIQRHLEEEVSYQHYVLAIANEAGVEDNSQLSFDFQPEYETLVLHQIEVWRDGAVQNRLADAEVEVIRQEKGSDRQLYDGELTAFVILKDIRPGDALSYSYSVEGVNPVFGGRVHSFYRFGFGSAVDFARRRFLWEPAKRSLDWRMHKCELEVQVSDGEGALRELLLVQEDLPRVVPEDETPSWHVDYPGLEISDYESWEKFGEWGAKLYQSAGELPEELREVCDSLRKEAGSKEEQVIGVLRWVQGNIRYLGSFLGEHTHEPYPLAQVHQRRFGDCKDKGMMVVAMLRYLGFDAAAAVVNTHRRRGVERYLPGPGNFNHLIVHLQFDGETYWLDPTATFQRGPLETVHTPAYGFAFVMRPQEAELRHVATRGYDVDWTVVEETYEVPAMTGGADLRVKTVVTGADANRLRRELADNSREKMEETYRDFYAKDFPGLEVAAPLTYVDDEESNRIEVTEHYRIETFWEEDEDSSQDEAYTGSIYARVLDASLDYPDKEKRTDPLAVRHPTQIRQTIRVELPEEWDLEAEKVSIRHAAFQFSSKLEPGGDHFVLTVEYRSSADAVLPAQLEAFQEAMDDLNDELYYGVSHWDDQEELALMDWAGSAYLLIAALAGLLLGCLLAGGTYFWDPAPRVVSGRREGGLGGWSALAVFWMALMTLVLLADGAVLALGAANLDVGVGAGPDKRNYYFVGVLFDACLLPVAAMVLLLSWNRRSSFPYLFVVLSVAALGVNSLLWILEAGLAIGGEDGGIGRGPVMVAAGVVQLLLWGGYLMISGRAWATYVRRRGFQAVPHPPPLPPVRGH